MKKQILILFLFSFITILTIPTLAQNTDMKLLAVSQVGNETLVGGVADLHLEIREGSGNVFIDTYPLSKFDTQLSIRFAKDVACKFAAIDCSQYDFLYTIRAVSSIIGGPSAGAAVTVLTYAQLMDLDINESVALTGTINSGRLIGNVGGIKEKVEGAAKAGLQKALVPINELNITQEDNTTLNIIEHGKTLGIEVVGVSDVEEAVYHFTGKQVKPNQTNFSIDLNYVAVMNNISNQLCNRTADLLELVTDSSFVIDNTTYHFEPINKTFKDGFDLYESALKLKQNKSFYASASQCYGANVKIQNVHLIASNNSNEYYEDRLKTVQNAVDAFDATIKQQQYTTITDLQTAMVVRQRLGEAQGYLDQAADLNITNESQKYPIIALTALAIERLNTASMWAQFFGTPGQTFEIDDTILRFSCKSIIEDALNRVQYAQLYVPTLLQTEQKQLKELNLNQDVAFCVAQASLTRAQINSLLSRFGLKEEDLTAVAMRKLDKAAEVLTEETINGRFPILGYSYYEYGKALLHTDPISALIYSEYALELSNLDLYLERPQYTTVSVTPRYRQTHAPGIPHEVIVFGIALLLLGIILGIKLTDQHYRKHYKLKKK